MGQGFSKKPKYSKIYEQGNVLGRGAFATVYACRRKKDPSTVFAVKILDKKHLSKNELDKANDEVVIMNTIEHKHAVRLVEVFDSSKSLMLVMELCSGGHLLDRIVEKRHYSERDAAEVMYQLASVVQHMHERGIVHRDLKPENILYETKHPHSPIKVTDFGLSKIFKDGGRQIMYASCGTPTYVAPEVILNRPYTNKCDMWSLGVIMYVLLSGCPPFYSKNLKTLLKRITNGRFDFRPSAFQDVSNEAKELIKELLTYDPEKRLSAAELLQKPWIKHHMKVPQKALRKASAQLEKLTRSISQEKKRKFSEAEQIPSAPKAKRKRSELDDEEVVEDSRKADLEHDKKRRKRGSGSTDRSRRLSPAIVVGRMRSNATSQSDHSRSRSYNVVVEDVNPPEMLFSRHNMI